jgi:hypothetical protein
MRLPHSLFGAIAIGFTQIVACTFFSLSNSAEAAFIYEYTGTPFTYISNPSGPFDTNDVVTGFVEFATAPIAGETGKSDVVDASFTAATYTITKADTVTHGSAFSFDFDSSLNVIKWGAVLATIPGSQSGSIRACNEPGIDLLIGGTNYCPASGLIFSDATYTDGSTGNAATMGSWSVVPIPAAAWLFGSGLLGLIGVARRKKAA